MNKTFSNRLAKILIHAVFIFFLTFCFGLIPVVLFASNPRSLPALQTKLDGKNFSANLKEGFHFNEKAPNGVQVASKLIKPTEMTARSLKVLNLTEGDLKGLAHLYVCDDKVTFCDRHVIPLSTQPGNELGQSSFTKKRTEKQSNGFILNDFETALERAKKQNKLVLVDFGARWCPACLRLDEEILKDSSFQKATKNFVKVKLDIDHFATQALERRYAVKGVPTLLFVNPDGKEITRFYDYQPMPFIKTVISEVVKNPQDLETLEKMTTSNELNKILIKRYFFSEQYSKAIGLMEKMEVKPPEYWFSKVAEAEGLAKKDPSNKRQLIQTLKSALEADPQGTRSLAWRLSLVQNLDGEIEKKRVAEEAFQLTQSLLNDTKLLQKSTQTDFLGEYTNLEGFYVAMMNAEVADSANHQTQKAWSFVIDQGQKYNIDASKPGASLRLLSALIRNESYEQALKLVDSMLKKSPQDGDLQRRKMRVLFGLKRYPEAIQEGEQALRNSYGANEYFVLEVLIKCYLASDEKEKARRLVEKYLNRNEIHFEEMASFKTKLESLQKELSLQ